MENIHVHLNGPAYTSAQERHGPPLEYVAEKLRASLEQLHGALASAQDESMQMTLHAAFHYAVVAFVALWCTVDDWGHDMVGVVARLRAMNRATFQQWLDLAEQDGSVLGRAAE